MADTTGRSVSQSHSLQWLFCCLVIVLLTACSRQDTPVRLGGATMGTTWSVTYVAPDDDAPDSAALQAAIEARLVAINASMSTYLPDSEISGFNRLPAESALTPSEDFLAVLETAIAIGSQTSGAYDVTVGPLVELWGFGASTAGYRTTIPAQEAIAAARGNVGLSRIRLDGGKLHKRGEVSLDFSSLAKGYAVDEVALMIRGAGVSRYLVEVGGEMALAGLSPRGDYWQIAIEQPEPGARSVAAALSLTDVAVATSGDYRNFFEYEGRRYSHTIDPRTGFPVNHELVSVTVVHPSATQADAWATALGVLGLEEAMKLAQAQGLAVYCIATQGGQFIHRHTAAMQPYLVAAAGAGQ